MSNLAQFVGGYGPITSIVNFYSSGGVSSGTNITATPNNNAKEVLSGALTAGALSGALVNVTGRGRLNLAAAYSKDGTARNIRLQVVVDGTAVFDATTNSVANVGYGLVAVGSLDLSNGAQVYQPVDFYQSLIIRVASSLTETDKVAVGINYETWA